MGKALPLVELAEFAEFRNGLNFNKDSHGTGCWLIGVTDFQSNFVPDYDSLKEVNPEGITKEDDYLKKGDIIFVRSNGNKALVGRSLYIDRDVKALFSGFCIRARLKSDVIDPLFLAYYTRTDHFKSSISSVAGTNINNLNQGVLGKVKLPLYPKDVQRSITNVLSSIDAKIDLNTRINAELEALAKTLYDYWFVQFDFPDENGKPYKSSGGAMLYNEELKREIPVGWESCRLESIVNIHDSKRIPLSKQDRAKRQGPYPYYGATSVMDYIDDYIFDGIYVLLAEDGSVMNQEGHPVLQYIWGKAWVNNHAHVLEATNGFSNEFLHMMLKNIPVTRMMSGSIQKKINQENLRKAIVLKPNQNILDQFQELLKPLYQKHINLNEENHQLAALRDWLLPMLMNGQVRVG